MRTQSAIIGLLFTGFGLVGLITRQYDSEGNAVRAGWRLEGLPAQILGLACLAFGIYVLYLAIRHRDK